MINHGLTSEQVDIIKRILIPFSKSIEKIAIFGSRATGRYKPSSDIDLVLYGTIHEEQIDRLNTLFEESLLPVTVDIQGYDFITYPPFKQHIDAFSKEWDIFEKASKD